MDPVSFVLEVFHNSVRNWRPTMTTAKRTKVSTKGIVADNSDQDDTKWGEGRGGYRTAIQKILPGWLAAKTAGPFTT